MNLNDVSLENSILQIMILYYAQCILHSNILFTHHLKITDFTRVHGKPLATRQMYKSADSVFTAVSRKKYVGIESKKQPKH